MIFMIWWANGLILNGIVFRVRFRELQCVASLTRNHIFKLHLKVCMKSHGIVLRLQVLWL